MKNNDSDLENLKQNYAIIQKKYKLPPFVELNDDFDIEKLQDKETDHLIRLVRMVMIEKIANVVRFLELLINPAESATPLFMWATLKGIKNDTKKDIEVVYKNLSKLELNSLCLDIIYDEKAEAGFVNEIFKIWAKEKSKLRDMTRKLGMTWTNEEKNNRGYLG